MVHETERDLLALIIGYRVREARRRKHLSQGELAQGVGSQSMISLIEGGRQLPPVDVLQSLATKLEDSVLEEHVHFLQSQHLSLADVTASNPLILLEILRSRRGRWDDIHGQVALNLCQHYYINRKLQIVLELCELVLEHMSSHAKFCAEANYFQGSSLLFMQEYEPAESALSAAEKMSDHLSDVVRGRLYFNLGYLHTSIDSQGLALWYARKATEVFQRIHDFPRYGKALGLLGTVQYRLGRLDDARETLELCCEITDKWGISDSDKARIEVTIAGIYAALSDLERAKSWFQRAQESGATNQSIHMKPELLRTQVYLQLCSGEHEAATNTIGLAIRAAEESSDSEHIAQCHLIAARYLPREADRLAAAQRAYEVTLDTPLFVEHALAAECLADIYEAMKYTGEATHYRKVALKAYRHYIAANSMHKHIIHRFPQPLDL